METWGSIPQETLLSKPQKKHCTKTLLYSVPEELPFILIGLVQENCLVDDMLKDLQRYKNGCTYQSYKEDRSLISRHAEEVYLT